MSRTQGERSTLLPVSVCNECLYYCLVCLSSRMGVIHSKPANTLRRIRPATVFIASTEAGDTNDEQTQALGEMVPRELLVGGSLK